MTITIGRFFYLKSWGEGNQRGYCLTKQFFYCLKHPTVLAVILYKASALINGMLFEDRYFTMYLIQLYIFVDNLLHTTIGFEELFSFEAVSVLQSRLDWNSLYSKASLRFAILLPQPHKRY